MSDPTGELPLAAALVGLGFIYLTISGLFWEFVRDSIIGGGDELTVTFASWALTYGFLGFLLIFSGTSLIFDIFGGSRLPFLVLQLFRSPASAFAFGVLLPCIGSATLVTGIILRSESNLLPGARALSIGLVATAACILTFSVPVL